MLNFISKQASNFLKDLTNFQIFFMFIIFLFKIKTPENTFHLRMHMYTPEKSSPGFKGMKNQIIIFTQFSTIELAINVALQETLPTITLSH